MKIKSVALLLCSTVQGAASKCLFGGAQTAGRVSSWDRAWASQVDPWLLSCCCQFFQSTPCSQWSHCSSSKEIEERLPTKHKRRIVWPTRLILLSLMDLMLVHIATWLHVWQPDHHLGWQALQRQIWATYANNCGYTEGFGLYWGSWVCGTTHNTLSTSAPKLVC